LLSDSPHGCTEAIMLAHGFSTEMLAGLVIDGFATTNVERMRAGRRPVEVIRITITEDGRQALAG
jgi:hypothetical protein